MLAERYVAALPERMIGDKAYDSDRLNERLRQEQGIELIAHNRRKRRRTQDQRPLRRYLRRWKIERMFAWLNNYRRLTSRSAWFNSVACRSR
jgi:transposase